MKYLVIIEETQSGFSAYSPDIEGCVVSGSTTEEVEIRMRIAIRNHLQGLKREKLNPPHPRSYSQYVMVTV